MYEAAPLKREGFALFPPAARFTDDTVLTLAVAEALLRGADYAPTLRAFARRYPDAGYGAMFSRWAWDDRLGPYGSWANGAAMRVSPVGFACTTPDEVLAEAARSARITHDHPEAVQAAQAVALAVFLGRTGAPPEAIREAVSLGGDSDTQACIAGRISQALWGTMPGSLLEAVGRRLPPEFLSTLDEFYTVYGVSLSRTDA